MDLAHELIWVLITENNLFNYGNKKGVHSKGTYS